MAQGRRVDCDENHAQQAKEQRQRVSFRVMKSLSREDE